MDPLTRAAALRPPPRDPCLAALTREVRTFCSAHVDGARIDREARLDGDLLGAVAARGWFGLTVPQEHGGVGLSLHDATTLVAELAAHDGSLATCVGLHSGLGLHALLHRGSAELHATLLPSIAAGERIVAFAATEPSAGSDIASVRTTLSADGAAFRLSGTKCYVTNGGIAGLVTVLARSPGLGGARAGHTLVLVDPRARGVTRGREEKKLGLRGSSTITLDFDDVLVTPEHVLGEVSHGLDDAHRALGWGRTFMAAGCLGTARAAVEAAAAHVASRTQFGRALIAFPLVRASIAEMRAELRAIERTLALVCAHDELAIPSTVVKLLASEGAFRVVDRALQLFGGAGYIEDTGIARRLRDVRVTRIFEGANDVLRLHLATDALTWPLESLRETSPALAAVLGEVRRTRGFRVFQDQALQCELADAIVASFAELAVRRDDDDIGRLATIIQRERSNDALLRAATSPHPARRELIERIAAASS